MDEISRAITLAFIAIAGAVLTQILLRWDQARRDTMLRLLNDLRHEQTHFEVVAYRARHLLLDGIDQGLSTGLHAKIDEVLFGEVYRESRLVTLCAELEAFGLPSRKYSQSAHAFRQTCYDIVSEALTEEDPTASAEAIERVKDEIKGISKQTKDMTKRIHNRFTWF